MRVKTCGHVIVYNEDDEKKKAGIRMRKVHLALVWIILLSSDTASQILLKSGAVQTKGWKVHYLVYGGYGLYILSFIAWMYILKTTRLTIALAAASLLYITIAGASYVFMGETIGSSLVAGTVLIAAGVYLLSLKEK